VLTAGGGTAVLDEPLTEAVPGVGVARAAALLEVFGSIEGIRNATPEELAAIHGIGPGLARRIHDTLSDGRTP
jgi:excinuclease ABC subunit C